MLADRLPRPEAGPGVCPDANGLTLGIEHSYILNKLRGFGLPTHYELLKFAVGFKTCAKVDWLTPIHGTGP